MDYILNAMVYCEYHDISWITGYIVYVFVIVADKSQASRCIVNIVIYREYHEYRGYRDVSQISVMYCDDL